MGGRLIHGIDLYMGKYGSKRKAWKILAWMGLKLWPLHNAGAVHYHLSYPAIWRLVITHVGLWWIIHVFKLCIETIDHFRITFGLFFKASLGAHPFICKLVLIHMQMKTNFHMKRWAPGLALKKRPKVIRKWPIEGVCGIRP